MKPDRLNRLNEKWLQRFKAEVKKGRSLATVHKYFQHLKTMLKWAVEQKYLKEVPAFPKEKKNAAKRKKHSKGRAVTLEEFERMLAAVRKSFPTFKLDRESANQKLELGVESLKYLLRGLWHSGLRLGEALSLTWDQWADGIRIRVDDDGDVFLLIDGGDQKNGEMDEYPVVDEFAEFLLAVPENERTGFIFNPSRTRGEVSRRRDTVTKWISDIGTAAGVAVDRKPDRSKGARAGDTVPVWASAHDLRRAFGTRWASRLGDPKLLMRLMRHANLETTLNFYVTVDAKDEMRRIRESIRKVNGEVNSAGSNAAKNHSTSKSKHP